MPRSAAAVAPGTSAAATTNSGTGHASFSDGAGDVGLRDGADGSGLGGHCGGGGDYPCPRSAHYSSCLFAGEDSPVAQAGPRVPVGCAQLGRRPEDVLTPPSLGEQDEDVADGGGASTIQVTTVNTTLFVNLSSVWTNILI